MKKVVNILLIALVLLGFFTVLTNAQTINTPSNNYLKISEREYDDGILLYFENAELDSAGYFITQNIDVSKYFSKGIDSLNIGYMFRPVKVATSDSINATVKIYTAMLQTGTDGSLAAKWKYSNNWDSVAVINMVATKATTQPALTTARITLKSLDEINPGCIRFRVDNLAASKAHYVNFGIFFKK